MTKNSNRDFAMARVAGRPRTKTGLSVAYAYAAIIIVLLIFQLITFNSWVNIFVDYGLFGTWGSAIMASIVWLIEIFSIPFLLRWKISDGFRFFSMFCGRLVAVWWFLIAIWSLSSKSDFSNYGILGNTVPVDGGWWAIFASLALLILSLWASWALHPRWRLVK